MHGFKTGSEPPLFKRGYKVENPGVQIYYVGKVLELHCTAAGLSGAHVSGIYPHLKDESTCVKKRAWK
jgi:hypothetical protein